MAETEPVLDERSARWRRLERARTLLVRGTVLRQAAAALDEAIAIFTTIGAPAWAGRAKEEAERLGRHRPGADTLTPSEARVAAMAASGLTNREMAERMVLSTRRSKPMSPASTPSWAYTRGPSWAA